MIKEGAGILRAHDQNVAAVVKGAARKCCFEFYTGNAADTRNKHSGLAANCPPNLSSDVGHQLATLSGTYGLLWFVNKEGKCLCSLRSNGDYDVSAIAKTFGGGGHKTATGFEVDIQTLLEWIK
jgi:nanoRNase/pAp phosphatase (c-di-AMP/oligoRNAs hydrolase)